MVILERLLNKSRFHFLSGCLRLTHISQAPFFWDTTIQVDTYGVSAQGLHCLLIKNKLKVTMKSKKNRIKHTQMIKSGKSISHLPASDDFEPIEHSFYLYQTPNCQTLPVQALKLLTHFNFHSYKLDQSISVLIIVGWYFSFLFKF